MKAPLVKQAPGQRPATRLGFLSALPLYLALPVVVIGIWKWADIAGYIKPYTMPPPEKIVTTAVEFWKEGALQNNIAASVIRVGEGFLIALAGALLLGIGIGLSKKLDMLTGIIIQILKPIPPIAYIPLAILWFGIGESSKIFIIVIGAFFPVLLNTVEGIKNIDRRFIELTRVYEAPRRRVVTHVILPGALPFIMAGVRIGLGNAWICVVAAEMIAATKGVGYMLMDGRNLARPDMVILCMLIIGIFGKCMDDGLKLFSRSIIRWN